MKSDGGGRDVATKSRGGVWRAMCLKALPGGFAVMAGLAVGGALPNGCRRDYVALSPLAVVVPADKAWSAAQYYASLRPNTIAVKGEGEGMLPLYSPGTVLVVEGMDYGALREGMTVMFRDRDGFRVVHYLVREAPGGWLTLGLAQGDTDREPMTRQNYLGVVIMAFSPDKPAPHSDPPNTLHP
jgi:hypothetical protein